MNQYKILVNEAAEYFRTKPEFKKMFLAMIDKYRRLGRIGGKITLYSATLAEQTAISEFLGIDYHGKRTINIALTNVENALANTKYGKIDLLDLLKAYYGEGLLTKEEEKDLYQKQKEAYFDYYLQAFDHPLCKIWLDAVKAKEPHTRSIHIAYGRDSEKLKTSILIILKAISNLPENYERLDHFAERIGEDKHVFDFGNDTARFFIDALRIIWNKQNPNKYMDDSASESGEQINKTIAEEDSEWLYAFKLLRDDIDNFVTACGVIGFSDDNKPIEYWHSAWLQGSILNLPLRELLKVTRVIPVSAYSDPHGSSGRVFVVQNANVYSALVEKLYDKKKNLPPIVCIHGQLKIAVWVMMDKLVAGGCTIYYSGDYDHDGLAMAYRLYQKYPNNVKLWHYGVGEYKASLTDVRLDLKRLAKIAVYNNTPLEDVAQAILENKLAGSQEAIVDLLVQDVLNS